MTMHKKRTGIGVICALVIGLGALSTAKAAKPESCAEITAACKAAGFVQGGAAAGNGLMVDCVRPILMGTTPRKASLKLPAIDPQTVAACKSANPGMGQGKGRDDTSPAVENATPQALPADHPAPPGSPNIVFVLTDDLAMNMVQYMPHVLKMQRDGMTFARYFVTDSLCCPSRTSIFTGEFPHDSGVFRNGGDDGGFGAFMSHRDDQRSFAVALQRGGYKTAMLGKYLNGYRPEKNGVPTGWNEWDVAGNGYPEFNYSLNQDGKVVQYGSDPQDYLTDVLSGLAVKFIRESAGAPFFIEVATFAPHAPYIPAPRDADAFPGLQAPRTLAYNAAPDASMPKWLSEFPPLSDDDMARIDKEFRMRAQSVQAVDKMIGDLQAAVAAAGQERNTYFIFSSDNGYHMGEHRMRPGKMTAFDTDIQVPLVVTGPGIAPGRTLGEIAENIDLCPTIAELAGTAPPANVDGHSLVPLLRGVPVADWRSVALVEHHNPRDDKDDPDAPAKRSGNPTGYEAIRLPNSLYVEYHDGAAEYHDLATDPDELHNTVSLLSAEQRASLSATVKAMTNCHDAQSCWTASHAAPGLVSAAAPR